uniref:hypothetical protein n=1 Tax=Acetatifactor sp. TaxID=1872090 RepID=UPI00405792DA
MKKNAITRKHLKNWLKYGISGQIKKGKYNDKSSIHLSRQQVAFSKESSKYAGCGILKWNFYTRFIPIFKDFGL